MRPIKSLGKLVAIATAFSLSGCGMFSSNQRESEKPMGEASLLGSWRMEIGGIYRDLTPVVVADGVLFTNAESLQLGLVNGWIVAGSGLPVAMSQFRVTEEGQAIRLVTNFGRWVARCDTPTQRFLEIHQQCWVSERDKLLPVRRGKKVDRAGLVVSSWMSLSPGGPILYLENQALEEDAK